MILIDAELNKLYKIEKINVKDKKLKLRLEELGLYKNAEIKLIKFSPFKKTILIELLDTIFAIKTEVAKNVFIEEV